MATIDIIIIVVYLSAIVVVGLVMQKKASAGIDSYFLGNRKLPWWALGASGMASNTDIAGTMINTAFIYALGTKGFFIEIPYEIGMYTLLNVNIPHAILNRTKERYVFTIEPLRAQYNYEYFLKKFNHE